MDIGKHRCGKYSHSWHCTTSRAPNNLVQYCTKFGLRPPLAHLATGAAAPAEAPTRNAVTFHCY